MKIFQGEHELVRDDKVGIPLVPKHRKNNGLNFDEGYRTVSPDVSVKAMPVSHGKYDTLGDYESTAFFIRHDPT